jgi:hypothetical protein
LNQCERHKNKAKISSYLLAFSARNHLTIFTALARSNLQINMKARKNQLICHQEWTHPIGTKHELKRWEKTRKDGSMGHAWAVDLSQKIKKKKKIFFILTRRERLLQLVSLLLVEDAKRVEVLGATDLELDNTFALLDPHRARIFPSCSDVDLLRLWVKRQRTEKHTSVKTKKKWQQKKKAKNQNNAEKE